MNLPREWYDLVCLEQIDNDLKKGDILIEYVDGSGQLRKENIECGNRMWEL